jgi:hypothetical protein
MAKRRITAKKSAPKASRPKNTPSVKRAAPARKLAKARVKQQLQEPGFHVYRHEIDGNPTNAPLIVDIPIAEGRGPNPSRPATVSFTAEMSDEYWQDQFAFRVVSLEGGRVRVMVSRVDKGSPEQGWGVKLIIRVLVVDEPAAR